MTTMRPIRDTISLEEALTTILESAAPIARTERVPLRDAGGRVIAAPPIATMDVPPFDRAAMDGYAVRAEDTFGAGRYDPKTLRSIETVHTAQVATRAVGAGECIQIATGAPMPQGADAVVMVEETERVAGSDEVRVLTPVYPRQHVGRRAADIAAGQPVLQAGDVLNPSRIGALAAVGAMRGRGLRAPADRDPLDRQRDRGARPAARPRADLRHQPLHALGDHHRARRRAGRPARGAGHDRRARRRRSTRRWPRTCWSSPAAARSASAT